MRFFRQKLLPITCCLLLIGFTACSGGGSNEPDPPDDDTTPPAAPSGLAATSGDAQVDLSWNAPSASDLDGYNVYRDTQSFSSVGNRTPVNGSLLSSTELTDTEVDNGATYYYRVTAVDDSGNESSLSSEAVVTPFPDPPDRP